MAHDVDDICQRGEFDRSRLFVPGWVFERLQRTDQVEHFWRLCADHHVRKYLFDGEIVPRSWASDAVAASAALFESGAAGLWLAYRRDTASEGPRGFLGLWVFDELGPDPQLLYALLRSEAGRGTATRFGEALVHWARRNVAIDDVAAAVDAPNVTSIRVLRKLGFLDDGEAPGAFGHTRLFRLPAGRPPLTMHTERLVLRRWNDDDLEPFAALNADPRVRRYFPDIMTRAASDDAAAKIRAFMRENGWGLWAVEVPGVAPFIGFVGLAVATFEAPFTPAVELGWRLAQEHWGNGYATEAARRVIDAAFLHLRLPEVIAMTAVINEPSRRVMEKVGLTHDPDRDFEHPNVPEGHELRPHVVYFRRSPRQLPDPRGRHGCPDVGLSDASD